jgi:putative copper resistance protein D
VTAALVLARLLQFLAAAAVGGAALFALYGLRGAPRPRWMRWILLLAAATGALAALAWLMAQASVLFGDPAQAFEPAAVWSVVADTGFGVAAALRLALFLLAAILCRFFPRPLVPLAVIGALTAASFAWTGHGAAGDGAAGAVHAAADVLHLLAASIWIGALFVLAPLTAGRDRQAAHAALAAFSGIGPAVVAVLVLTGLVNSWFLVGPDHLPDLLSTAYGRLLSLKLVLFAAMLGLAALNRLVLTPRLAAPSHPRALRASVLTETLIGVLVLLLVAWLGTLPPPGES